jgi:hypothetical protein
MKSIARQDNGQSYDEYLTELAQAAGIENPTREQLVCLEVLTQLARVFLGLWPKLPKEERTSCHFALQSRVCAIDSRSRSTKFK